MHKLASALQMLHRHTGRVHFVDGTACMSMRFCALSTLSRYVCMLSRALGALQEEKLERERNEKERKLKQKQKAKDRVRSEKEKLAAEKEAAEKEARERTEEQVRLREQQSLAAR